MVKSVTPTKDIRVKNPWWVVAPLLTMTAFSAGLFIPWMRRVDLGDHRLAVFCMINAAIWWVVLWWSIHHLGFRLSPLFIRPQPCKRDSSKTPALFAILYCTCDDFDWAACQSCVQQDYAQDDLHTVICDDSSDAAYRQMIDEFAQAYPSVRVVRRADRQGFKAGNLNHAIAAAVPDSVQWMVIADADQNLPYDYITRFSAIVACLPEHVAYVQGRNVSDHEFSLLSRHATPFQRAMGHEIDMFYGYDLMWRTSAGFLPLIGHGAALRRSAWERVKFPEIVSEDFALSMELRNQSLVGIYADSVESWESFPESFGAFVVRLRKFSGGTAQLYRVCLKRFLLGPSTFTEKLDLLMLIGWYALMPWVVINGYLSAYICHQLWERQVSALHPMLPYVFVALFLANLPALYSTAPTLLHAFQQWFWSSAIYGACMPIASIQFIRHLLGAKPRFDRTPKGGQAAPIGHATCVAMVFLGLLTLAFSVYWSSPFSPVLFGLGLSYISIPLYTQLHKSNIWGAIARLAVLLPGTAYVYALWKMWSWQGI